MQIKRFSRRNFMTLTHDSQKKHGALEANAIAKLTKTIFIALLAIFMVSVTVAPADAGLTRGDGRVWGTPSSGAVIDVCFINGNDADVSSADKQLIRSGAEQWSAVANVSFTGWGNCTLAEKNEVIAVVNDPNRHDVARINIHISNEASAQNRSFIGTAASAGGVAGATIELRDPDKYLGGDAFCRTNAGRDCASRSVIHEFGHAIGLHHEHLRPEAAAGSCADDWPTSEGPARDQMIHLGYAFEDLVGQYDPYSIMNYCRLPQNDGERSSPLFIAGAPRLTDTWTLAPSSGDIAAAQHLYGPARGTAPVSTPIPIPTPSPVPAPVPTCNGLDATVFSPTGIAVTLRGTSGNDVIVGTSGNDTIVGYGGNDTICAGDGDDFISAGDGNDRLYSGAGADRIYGGAGNDRIYSEAGNDWISSGTGDDWVDGGSGNDTVLGYGGKDDIRGGSGDDTLSGGGAADTIYGQDGNDTINGNQSADKLYGQNGNDVIDGDDGNDVVNGGPGNDKLWGGTGDDTILGSTGTDQLAGEDGKDKLYGHGGNDTLFGGLGSDLFDGGGGTNDYCATNTSERTNATGCERFRA